MKSQKHNEGDLKELKVKLEKELVDAIECMAENGKMKLDDLVCIALKRYRASHADLEGCAPKLD